MSTKIYNRFNFHNHTFCVFHEVNQSEIAHLISNYKSKSGSIYYFVNDGVYRQSNHWGRAANCKWRLETNNINAVNREKTGFALWTQFHEDNNFEKLYFISADFQNKSVAYFHKNQMKIDENAILRTASETTKRIKQIRNLIENDNWTKYFATDNIETLRITIIEKLIHTDQSLQQIKSELLYTL